MLLVLIMIGDFDPRSIAIEVLFDIIYKNQSRDLLLKKYFDHKDIAENLKSLSFNIIINSLRYKEVFDEIISSSLNIPVSRIQNRILISLYVALSQILTMDRIPVYAAVSETIEAYKQLTSDTKGSAFLNYALRKISGNKNLLIKFKEGLENNSFYKRLERELKKEIRPDELFVIYKSSFERPPTSIRIRRDISLVIETLKNKNTDFRRSEIVPDSIIIKDILPLNQIKEILDPDSFAIQSELSQLAAHLLGIKKGESLLDVCSGNQIKSQQIYDMLDGEVEITSVDIKDIKDPAFNFINADARCIKFDRLFDKILIDAPCSGLGTLSSNPEIKFRISINSIKRHSAIQYQILSNVSKYIKNGGRILYSVCTITRSETEKVIKKFVEENRQFEIIIPDVRSELIKKFITEDGFLRIVNYNKESFFYALLTRK